MRASFFLTTSTVFWALNFYLAIFMMRSASAVESAFFRYLCAIILMSVVIVPTIKSWSRIKQNIPGILLAGGIGLFGFNLFFFLALQFTSALNASLIGATNPAVTFILAWIILKQPIKGIHWLGIATSFFGVLVLLTKGNLLSVFEISFNPGDVLMMGSNIAFGMYHIYVGKYGGRIPNLQFTYFTNVVCFLGFVLLLFFYPIGPVKTYPQIFWLSMLGMGALGTFLAYILWNTGIKAKGSANASIFLNLIPIFVALFGWIFGEDLKPYHIWSLIIIISGILIIHFYDRPKLKTAH